MTILMIPLLVCALAACLAIAILTNEPDNPLGERFKPNTADARAFDDEIIRASNQAAAADGRFYFLFYEQQLSSWLALEGAQYADLHDFAFPFSDLQVGIADGRFTFVGHANQYGVKVPLTIVIEPRVDRAGHLDFNIDSANLAGVPLPAFMLDSITNQIETKLFETIGGLPGDYRLFPETLSAQNGQFVIQGQVVR